MSEQKYVNMAVPKRLHPAVAQDFKILHSGGSELQW